MQQRLVVITTGGTIAMRQTSKGIVPALTGQDLTDAIPELADLAFVELVEYSNKPSGYITPYDMMALCKMVDIELKKNDVAGVVVTHGTDTLEETAYFLDMTVHSDKPVVVTGAMRSANERGYDGTENLLAAVQTALSPQMTGQGTLVVLNNEIHSARDVTKTHTSQRNSFASPNGGILGFIDDNTVITQRQITRRATIPLPPPHKEQPLADIHILNLSAGCSPLLFETLLQHHVDGIILEAFGRGNIPPYFVPYTERAIQQNIPVVLTSRCPGGRVLNTYGYEGGAAQLQKLGVILAEDLSAPKARLRLMLVLTLTDNQENIRTFFEQKSIFFEKTLYEKKS